MPLTLQFYFQIEKGFSKKIPFFIAIKSLFVLSFSNPSPARRIKKRSSKKQGFLKGKRGYGF